MFFLKKSYGDERSEEGIVRPGCEIQKFPIIKKRYSKHSILLSRAKRHHKSE